MRVCKIGTLNIADNPPAKRHITIHKKARSPSNLTKMNDCKKPSNPAKANPIKNAPSQTLKILVTDRKKAGNIPKNPPQAEYKIHCLRKSFSSVVNKIHACPIPSPAPIIAPDSNAPNPPVNQTNSALSNRLIVPPSVVTITQRNNQYLCHFSRNCLCNVSIVYSFHQNSRLYSTCA